jgi:hypothetical protein
MRRATAPPTWSCNDVAGRFLGLAYRPATGGAPLAPPMWIARDQPFQFGGGNPGRGMLALDADHDGDGDLLVMHPAGYGFMCARNTTRDLSPAMSRLVDRGIASGNRRSSASVLEVTASQEQLREARDLEIVVFQRDWTNSSRDLRTRSGHAGAGGQLGPVLLPADARRLPRTRPGRDHDPQRRDVFFTVPQASPGNTSASSPYAVVRALGRQTSRCRACAGSARAAAAARHRRRAAALVLIWLQ